MEDQQHAEDIATHGPSNAQEDTSQKEKFASPLPISNKTAKSNEPSTASNETAVASTCNDSTSHHVSKENNKSSLTRDKIIKNIPYDEPIWSGIADKNYTLEVLKNGCIVDIWKLNDKAYYIFGRSPVCDFVLDHPSVSRCHAVLQFHKYNHDDAGKVGFYMYDLASTHGSQINKSPVEPRRYYRLRVGHMIKFGSSSRVYILQGPSDDQEEEIYVSDSRKAVKQIMNAEEVEEWKHKQEKDRKGDSRKEDKNDVTWGIDFGVEEEDADIDIIEKARTSHDDDSYFVKDPKKALRHFFETAGVTMEYEVCESGTPRNRTYQARIKLPVETSEGNCIYGEGTAEKKKDAVVACALDGCRILEAYGMLRSSVSIKRKRKNWEDNDYYDSDEDNFLDRTGDLENKRIARMRRAGKITEEAETFQSLSLKLKEIQDEMNRLRSKLNSAKGQQQTSEADSLDAFMNNVSNTLDARAITSIRLHLSDLRKKEEKLIKLVEIARPAELPEYLQLKKTTDSKGLPASPNRKPDGTDEADKGTPVDLKSKVNEKPSVKVSSVAQNVSLKAKGVQFLGAHPSKMTGPKVRDDDDDDIVEFDSESDSEEPKKGATSMETNKTVDDARQYSVRLPDRELSLKEVEITTINQELDDSSNNSRNAGPSQPSQRNDDDECIDWLPPEDQFGDGKTSLNTKLGY
ncbi:uncharacterized protein TRIADDRAFT_64173 [Trichoplax adhaerens]|uniref:FHA domain-containing protein n=1 Tax=Trichoplax adhaerens TaxID=10228 RepID=B3S570_TRIAD|nr:hypothetical protein TRIADDRAFT_64173 [Trichoplax adhaerens]EDV22213.1 hypothetical protein TRIADDRAFT_64173 [Trichoplax adhaerens]|eukprot:XP_002115368.1 hypothetical protein TRIADDRAFT_64173 [Trichoplax adhaerens]